MEYLRVQLKVCEGCGKLWFRATRMEGVYGSCCAGKLEQHARAALPQRTPRSKGHGLQLVKSLQVAQAVTGGAE